MAWETIFGSLQRRFEFAANQYMGIGCMLTEYSHDPGLTDDEVDVELGHCVTENPRNPSGKFAIGDTRNYSPQLFVIAHRNDLMESVNRGLIKVAKVRHTYIYGEEIARLEEPPSWY